MGLCGLIHVTLMSCIHVITGRLRILCAICVIQILFFAQFAFALFRFYFLLAQFELAFYRLKILFALAH